MSQKDFTGKLTKLWPILVDHYRRNHSTLCKISGEERARGTATVSAGLNKGLLLGG